MSYRNDRLFPRIIAVVALAAGLFIGISAMLESNAQEPKMRPSNEELRKKLTPEQYKVTQEEGTEAPFHNAYWDNHEDGIYVDVVSGEPLFSSIDKFNSGTGWPSFSKPLAPVETRTDRQLGVERTEVRSKTADSHLGHVFDDGPGPNGQRFCINSAAMRFVPLSKMQAEGFGRYLFAFADKQKWEVATLAGGCFWGMEELLHAQPGVITTQVGYTGGKSEHPTYQQVSTGSTGHAEAIQILFDPHATNYEALLKLFFRMHDPTTLDRQSNDRGSQYRSAIFVKSETQRRVAEDLKARVEKSGKWGGHVVTQIVPLTTFWRAEDYHQEYLEKHPDGYRCHVMHNFDF